MEERFLGGIIDSVFGGGSKQTVTQQSTNETNFTNTANISTDFIIETEDIANVLDSVRNSLKEFGNAFLSFKVAEEAQDITEKLIESQEKKKIADQLLTYLKYGLFGFLVLFGIKVFRS